MERELFDWEDLIDATTEACIFQNCILKVAIGPYSAGSKIASITICYDHGYMVFHSADGELDYKCRLSLIVGEEQEID